MGGMMADDITQEEKFDVLCSIIAGVVARLGANGTNEIDEILDAGAGGDNATQKHFRDAVRREAKLINGYLKDASKSPTQYPIS